MSEFDHIDFKKIINKELEGSGFTHLRVIACMKAAIRADRGHRDLQTEVNRVFNGGDRPEFIGDDRVKVETERRVRLYGIATADVDRYGVPRPGMETYDHVCRVAKEAVKQALEIAAEDVKYTIRPYVDDHGFDQEEWRVDKKSILNVIERVK